MFLGRKPAAKLTSWFRERAPLVKKYWLFVIPFAIFNGAGYLIIVRWFYEENVISVFGQISATIFAIFVGNIAFSEFGENKFDKLDASAHRCLGRREFTSAMIKFEEAHSIKPKETDVMANLLETYLICGMYDKFDSKISMLERHAIEDRAKLNHFFLACARQLVIEHMSEAKMEIKKSIEFVNDNPRVRDRFSWSMDEMMASPAYLALGESTRKVYSNYFAYMKRQLSDEAEARFVAGHYEHADDEPKGAQAALGV